MSSNNKGREETATLTSGVQATKRKLSRRLRYNKNKKLMWEQEHAEDYLQSAKGIIFFYLRLVTFVRNSSIVLLGCICVDKRVA